MGNIFSHAIICVGRNTCGIDKRYKVVGVNATRSMVLIVVRSYLYRACFLVDEQGASFENVSLGQRGSRRITPENS